MCGRWYMDAHFYQKTAPPIPWSARKTAGGYITFSKAKAMKF